MLVAHDQTEGLMLMKHMADGLQIVKLRQSFCIQHVLHQLPHPQRNCRLRQRCLRLAGAANTWQEPAEENESILA